MKKSPLGQKDFAIILIVILLTIFVCNIITPFFYKYIKTDLYRTHLIIEKLKEPDFNPEMVVFGSSTSMMGINCYQMSKELDLDVYNFSTIGQSPVESSLYYSMLPSTVKTVIQIVKPPIKRDDEEERLEKGLDKSHCNFFSLGGYLLSDDIKQINPHSDLSVLEENEFIVNIKARGAFLVPGLTYLLLPRDKVADADLKFCNSYLTQRHAMYDRTIDQAYKRSMKDKKIEIDIDEVETLKGYVNYLRSHDIKMVFVLMPSNPDTEEFSSEQMKMIGDECNKQIPEAIFLNYLSAIQDTKLFFDSGHLNREGAEVLTGILDKDLSKLLK